MTQDGPKTLQTLQPGLRCVIAGNPSPMTHWGTNTYILGQGRVGVIDPGPDDPAHLNEILDALAPGETISHIFVTHSHLDHSPLAAPLSRATGAPVFAFGDSASGRSDIMSKLAASGLAGGGEGVDHGFHPDENMVDTQTVAGDGWELTAHWTPGHFGNHLCFSWDDVVFSGDHIMGWASSLVSPPDGDLTDFLASTRKLARFRPSVFYPGHGAAVTDPAGRIKWLLEHRLGRETSILNALSEGGANISSLTKTIYTDTPTALLPAAERNVFAHLVDLVQSSRVRAIGPLAFDAEFRIR